MRAYVTSNGMRTKALWAILALALAICASFSIGCFAYAAPAPDGGDSEGAASLNAAAISADGVQAFEGDGTAGDPDVSQVVMNAGGAEEGDSDFGVSISCEQDGQVVSLLAVPNDGLYGAYSYTWECSTDGGESWEVWPAGSSEALVLSGFAGYLFRVTLEAVDGEGTMRSVTSEPFEIPASEDWSVSLNYNPPQAGGRASFEAVVQNQPATPVGVTYFWQMNDGSDWKQIPNAADAPTWEVDTSLLEDSSGDGGEPGALIQIRVVVNVYGHGTKASNAQPLTVRDPVTDINDVDAKLVDPKTGEELKCVAYTGQAIEPKVVAEGLAQGVDYEVSYAANKDAGTAKVVLSGIGKYTGTKELTFEIAPVAIQKGWIALAKKSYVYTGKPLRPAVKVTAKAGGKDKVLSPKADYSVRYSGNVGAGTATATVTGKGNYKGKASVTYRIAPAANSLTVKRTAVGASFTASGLKKAARSVVLPKATAKFGNAKWSVAAKDKKGVLTLKGGRVMVKKGAKKGAYTMKVKAAVAKTKNYAGARKFVTVKVVVK